MLISMALISCGLLTYEVMVTRSKDHTEAVLPVDLYVDMYWKLNEVQTDWAKSCLNDVFSL